MLADLTTLHSPGTLIFLLAVAAGAGLARGFSGFGAALIFVPLASTAIGPKLAVPLLLVVDSLLALGFLPGANRHADRGSVAVMIAGAVFGVPAGTYLLATLDPLLIRWSIVFLVLMMLVLLMSGWRFRGSPTRPLTVSVGFASGLLSGTAQVGGPPVVAYWLSGGMPALVVRANFILYFAASSALSLVWYTAGGLITREVMLGAVLVGPAYGIGLWMGGRMFGLASEETFRRICFLMIAASAVLSLPILDGVLR